MLCQCVGGSWHSKGTKISQNTRPQSPDNAVSHPTSLRSLAVPLSAVAYRGGFGVFKPPPLKFRRPSKNVPNSTQLWKLLKISEFRMPTHQDVWKKDSKILKLSLVRNCFTLAMTNKLVVIINRIKVPKIMKILLYEMKLLVTNYSCLQNPWLRGYCPQIPILSVLFPQLNLLNTPPNKIPGYATDFENLKSHVTSAWYE